MGNNQGTSTRKLSIENDTDPATVIKVSENVVQRIRSGVVADSEAEFREQQNKVRTVVRRNETANTDIFEDGIPFVTARMIRQEVEDELEKNNQYWEKRVVALQESHQKINRIMEEEYIRSVEEIKKELPNLPADNRGNVCKDKKGIVLSCYKKYPKRPLLCAQEVEAFNCCLKNERYKLLQQN